MTSLTLYSSFKSLTFASYLVENIWGGQSSQNVVRDVFELMLSCWEKKEHWSPWKCILLTKDEAKAPQNYKTCNRYMHVCE